MTIKDTLSKTFDRIWNRPKSSFLVREPYSGAWQQNREIGRDDLLSFHAIFSCISLIASDISKLELRLVKKDANGIWNEVENPAYSPVIRRPNAYQNRIQFYEAWILSILQAGNTYVLKKRDARNVVRELFILDPARVTPLVSESGQVVYELQTDSLAGISEIIRIPSSEILHDRMTPLYHPLVGISPIFACSLPVTQGIEIQRNSAAFFRNNSRPGGVLMAPGSVSDETVEQLKKYWDSNYTGANAGKVAVVADGLTYKQFDVINAANSQVVEQLKLSAETVASVFHVPYYLIGGPVPSYDSVESLNQIYYSQCLQQRIESIELCLSECLGLANDMAVEFNLDSLLRMDSRTLIEAEKIAVGAGIKSPNEARRKLGLGPVVGGESPMIQIQNYSLAALARRDNSENPPAANSNAKIMATLQEIKKNAA